MLFKIVYLAGIFFRNRLIFESYRELMRTDKMSLADLKRLQNERLRDLVAHAVAHSEYYRSLFENCNIDPDDVQSVDDLKSLKLTTKLDLLENNERIQNRISGEKEYLSETSGSSGFPLIFRRNQRWDAMHNASVIRGYGWHGVKPWERNGYLWGYNITGFAALKTRFLDVLQNRFRLFSYNEDEMQAFCKKLRKAQYIGGYSSMIHELSKYVSGRPEFIDTINLKMVKGTSEKIFEAYQENVNAAFGNRMVSEYGAAEAGIIAFECPQGSMHINIETCVVEVVDSEILVTNLFSHSFPIIRYALGDYIEMGEAGACSCGRKSPIIETVTGRVGSSIQGVKNVFPSLVLYYIFKNLAMNHSIELNYQAVQDRSGHLEFRLERDLTPFELDAFSDEFSKYFSTDMSFTISGNERLVSGKGKTKDFVSLL